MASFLRKLYDQANIFDGGKSYKNQTPAPRKPTPYKIPQQSFINKAVDVFSPNTQADQARRLNSGQSPYYVRGEKPGTYNPYSSNSNLPNQLPIQAPFLAPNNSQQAGYENFVRDRLKRIEELKVEANQNNSWLDAVKDTFDANTAQDKLNRLQSDKTGVDVENHQELFAEGNPRSTVEQITGPFAGTLGKIIPNIDNAIYQAAGQYLKGMNELPGNRRPEINKFADNLMDASSEVNKDIEETIDTSRFSTIPRKGEMTPAVNLSGGAASLASSIGLTWATGNPYLASATFGAKAAGDQLEEARKAGLSPWQALTVGGVSFLTEAGLEKVGLNKWFNGSKAGNILSNMAYRSITEGLQESSQSLSQSVISGTYKPVDYSEAVKQALVEGGYGAILGGPGSVTTDIATKIANDPNVQQRIKQNVADRFRRENIVPGQPTTKLVQPKQPTTRLIKPLNQGGYIQIPDMGKNLPNKPVKINQVSESDGYSKSPVSDSALNPTEAVSEYQDYGYTRANESLRNNKITPRAKHLLDGLDNAFNKIGENKQVYTHRYDGAATTADIFEKTGIGKALKEFEGMKHEDYWNNRDKIQSVIKRLEGQEFTDKGYLSTSKEKSGALKFGDGGGISQYGIPALVTINGKTRVIDIERHGFTDNEQELLLPRNTSYKIKYAELQPTSLEGYVGPRGEQYILKLNVDIVDKPGKTKSAPKKKSKLGLKKLNEIGAVGKNVNKGVGDPLDNLRAEARKYKSAEEFVKAKIDDYAKTTPEYKKWAKGADNIIEGYHGTPYKFDQFEIGKKQAGAYDLDGISFATNRNNAEPFSRQYPDTYYEGLKNIDAKYGKELKDIQYKPTASEQKLLNSEFDKVYPNRTNTNSKIDSEIAGALIKIEGRRNLEKQLSPRAYNLLEKIAFGDKQKAESITKLAEKAKLDLEKSVAPGNIYKVQIKGNNIIDEVGEELGFTATRNGTVAELDGGILRIKDADTGQYIGEEIIVNDPTQAFIINSPKNKSQLTDLYNQAKTVAPVESKGVDPLESLKQEADPVFGKDGKAWQDYNKRYSGLDMQTAKSEADFNAVSRGDPKVFDKTPDAKRLQDVISGDKKVGYVDNQSYDGLFAKKAQEAGLYTREMNGVTVAGKNKADVDRYVAQGKNLSKQEEHNLIGYKPERFQPKPPKSTPTRTLEQISASQSELAQRIIKAKQSGDTKAMPKLKEELDAIKSTKLPLYSLKKIVYNKDRLKGQLYEELNKAKESGKISEEAYQATLIGEDIPGKGLARRDTGSSKQTNQSPKVTQFEKQLEQTGLKPSKSNLKFIETAKTSQNTTKEVKSKLKSKDSKTITNVDTLATATERIKARGLEKSIEKAKNNPNHTTNQQAERLELIDTLQTKGRFDEAVEIVEKFAVSARKLGQGVQIANAYNKLTPQGILRYAQRQVEAAKRENPKRYNNLKIDATQAKRLTTLAGQVQGINEKTQISDKFIQANKPLKRAYKNIVQAQQNFTDGVITKEQYSEAIQYNKKLAQVGLQTELSKVVPTSGARKAATLWKAGLLTGIKGGVFGNTVGNSTYQLLNKISDVPASGVDKALSAFTGRRSKMFTLKGQIKGLKEGAQQSKEKLTTGVGAEDLKNKFDYKSTNYSDSWLGKSAQAYTDFVFDFYGAADAPFKGFAREGALYELAKVEAVNKDLRGQEAVDFINDFVKDPPSESLELATEKAKELTFQSSSALGSALQGFKQGAAKKGGPVGELVSEVVLPFTGVPSNIASAVYKYSPVKPVKDIVDSIKLSNKGQFDQQAQRQLSESIGKGMTGSSLMLLGMALSATKLLTLGFPSDDRERELWDQEGKTPYSIKIGGKWRSLNYTGPIMALLSIGGEMQNALYNDQGIWGTASTGLISGAKSTLSSSPLTGLQDVLDALDSTGGNSSYKALQYINNLSGSVIPTIVKDISNVTDSKKRTTTNPIDTIMSRIPGLRNILEPKVDVLGKDSKQLPTGVGAITDPFKSSTAKSTALTNEAERLKESVGINVFPTKADRSIKFSGDEKVTKLNPKEYNELQRTRGLLNDKYLNEAINSQEYKNASDEEKAKILTDIESNITSASRYVMEAKYSKGIYSPNYSGTIKPDTKTKSLLDNKFSILDYATAAKTSIDKANGITTTKSNNNISIYQDALDKFNKDKKSGAINYINEESKKRLLNKLKVYSEYDTDTTNAYKLSKSDLYNLVSSKQNGQAILNRVLNLDSKLVKAGFKSKFYGKYGDFNFEGVEINKGYSKSTEQYRNLAKKYFGKEANKALWVIQHESGGDPNILGDGGAAKGLFQNQHIPSGLSVEEQFKAAKRLYDSRKAKGGTGWEDWGENNLYNGQKFGALGNNPYPGDDKVGNISFADFTGSNSSSSGGSSRKSSRKSSKKTPKNQYDLSSVINTEIQQYKKLRALLRAAKVKANKSSIKSSKVAMRKPRITRVTAKVKKGAA